MVLSDIEVPFVSKSLDFTQPVDALMAVIGLIVGFMFFHMADDVGMMLKSRVNSFLGIGSEGQQQSQNALEVL